MKPAMFKTTLMSAMMVVCTALPGHAAWFRDQKYYNATPATPDWANLWPGVVAKAEVFRKHLPPDQRNGPFELWNARIKDGDRTLIVSRNPTALGRSCRPVDPDNWNANSSRQQLSLCPAGHIAIITNGKYKTARLDTSMCMFLWLYPHMATNNHTNMSYNKTTDALTFTTTFKGKVVPACTHTVSLSSIQFANGPLRSRP